MDELLHTGSWGAEDAAEVPFLLWLGVDGIPPGLKVSYVFLVDARGKEGGVWEPGRSPATFYWACRSRKYKPPKTVLLRVEHLNYKWSGKWYGK